MPTGDPERSGEAGGGGRVRRAIRGEPLPQIGTDVWQALWDSARAYSVNAAYPEQDFPVTDPGSVCVLCQQELSPQASDRLNRFEAFVRDDSQQRADAARATYDTALARFAEGGLSLAELAPIVATIRDDLRQDALATEIRRASLQALWRHRQISRRHADAAAVIDAKIVALPRQALSGQVADIEARGSASRLRRILPRAQR